MKPLAAITLSRAAALAAFLAAVWAGLACAGAAVVEKEYDDATVLLVDHAGGLIGVSWADGEGETPQKLSFRVDPDRLDVTNPFNHDLEFVHVTPGDHVDLYTEVSPDGLERVVTIYNYSKLAAE